MYPGVQPPGKWHGPQIDLRGPPGAAVDRRVPPRGRVAAEAHASAGIREAMSVCEFPLGVYAVVAQTAPGVSQGREL